jgi:hypothetical protein
LDAPREAATYADNKELDVVMKDDGTGSRPHDISVLSSNVQPMSF